jgi:hypothetical protein
MAKSCDYYITESVFVEYDNGGEVLMTLRIDRSKLPRWIGKLQEGQSVDEWIEENEELLTRIVYEEGVWTVKAWEQLYYTEELADMKIDFSRVVSIKRGVGYRLR